MLLSWDEFRIQLGEVPALPGARCRGRTELFDATIHPERGGSIDDLQYARNRASDLCGACPALNRCRAWVDSLPPNQRPHGVIAGRLNTSAAVRNSGTES